MNTRQLAIAACIGGLGFGIGTLGIMTGMNLERNRLPSEPIRMHMKDINGDGHEDKVFSNDSGFYQVQYNFPSQRGVAYLTLGEILENHGYSSPRDNTQDVIESANARYGAGEISELERRHLIIEAEDRHFSLDRQWGIEREKLIEKYSPNEEK